MQREQYAGDLTHWSEKLNEALDKRVPGWRDLSERTQLLAEQTSPLFLQRCGYYMMSPHVSPHGARNKVVKVLRPGTRYEKARKDVMEKEAKEAKNPNEETSIYTSLQRIVSMRLFCMSCLIPRSSSLHSFKSIITEYSARQVSIYGVFEGTLSLAEGSLLFLRHSHKSDLTPSLHSCCRMPHLTQIHFHAVTGLFKRVYDCQQSAFELFYRKNGYVDSLYITFPSQVASVLHVNTSPCAMTSITNWQ